MAVLDIDAVRAFVTIADMRSFTRAAEALDTSQAAISLKIKRLEDKLSFRLLERTPRSVQLSGKGAAFLAGARELLAAHERALACLSETRRRFSIGIAAHVIGPEITCILARLQEHDPYLTIEMQIDSSKVLLDAFDRRQLHAAIVRRDDNRGDGKIIARERYGWFAAPTFNFDRERPLRIASLASICGVKNIAVTALEGADLRWEEVFVGGGFSAVQAAVSAGLAVAAFPNRVAPAGTIDVGEMFDLPPLPLSEILLFSSISDQKGRQALDMIAAAFRTDR